MPREFWSEWSRASFCREWAPKLYASWLAMHGTPGKDWTLLDDWAQGYWYGPAGLMYDELRKED